MTDESKVIVFTLMEQVVVMTVIKPLFEIVLFLVLFFPPPMNVSLATNLFVMTCTLSALFIFNPEYKIIVSVFKPTWL